MPNTISRPIPVCAGIGLKSQHFQEISQKLPTVGWFEGHSENYFADGGMNRLILETIAQHYPISLHGVGLSLGSASGINTQHLKTLKTLVDDFQPGLVSEHLSWSTIAEHTINDLLPLPYTEEALTITCDNISRTQETLNRTILIENPSTYLEFEHSEIPESQFLREIVQQTGCGILLDINNIYVNHINHGYDTQQYLQDIPKDAVQEMHLAGHMRTEVEGQTVLIDHHGDHVSDSVWALYNTAIELFGPTPTLIEWDTNIPPLETWLNEAEKANQILRNHA